MNPKTLAQSAYRQLHDDIVDGRIPANTVLNERDLAATLGISRTPLREALSALARDQVIDRLANGVVLVRRISVEQLLEVVELQSILGQTAAAAAAERSGLTPELTTCRARLMEFTTTHPADSVRFDALDTAFHDAVAAAAGLDMLPALLAPYRTLARRRPYPDTDLAHAQQAEEHLAVIAAIAARDATAARAATAAHFRNMRQRILGWLNKD